MDVKKHFHGSFERDNYKPSVCRSFLALERSASVFIFELQPSFLYAEYRLQISRHQNQRFS